MQVDLNIKKNSVRKLIVKHILFFVSVGGTIAFLTLTGIGCPLRALTGIPCPTCGLTRSVLALFRLDFKASFDYFPLTVPLLAAIGIALHLDVIKADKKEYKYMRLFVVGVAILTILLYLYNIIFHRLR